MTIDFGLGYQISQVRDPSGSGGVIFVVLREEGRLHKFGLEVADLSRQGRCGTTQIRSERLGGSERRVLSQHVHLFTRSHLECAHLRL